MKILYGAPGTGKTWLAAREAVKAIEPDLYAAAMQKHDPDKAIRSLHDGLVADGRILWVTFHPSYSYEDFVEGYRPIVDESGNLSYLVVDGPFKSLCLRARFETDLQIGERLNDGAGRPAGIVASKDAGGWVVRVTPKRSDKVAPSLDKYVPRFVVDRILSMGISPQIFSIAGTGTYELAEYGIDPTDEDLPSPEKNETATIRTGATIRKFLAARTGMFSSSDLTNAAHIGSVVRRLKELQSKNTHERKPVALIIDEINRAEPSRVFGELLTLLEIDKREGATEEKKVWLPYSKNLFSVPSNVSIIGTMNTVDRSLTALDFAMRRRFDFVMVAAQPELLPINYGGVNVQDLLRRINNRVTTLLGNGYEFGHSFLMLEKLDSIQIHMNWRGNPDGHLCALAHVLRNNLIPTLAEYFHDDWTKVRAIAGETIDGGEKLSLLQTPTADPQFLARLPDEYESSESNSLTAAHWWNPNSKEWDSAKFLRFITSLAAGK